MRFYTIGLYQPYASLMLAGKIESRWVRLGYKPPFPLGHYMIYATQKAYEEAEFVHMAGEHYPQAKTMLDGRPQPRGCMIAVGLLFKVEAIKTWDDANKTYYSPPLESHGANGPPFIYDHRMLYGLHFKAVLPTKPLPFRGKQGVGIADLELTDILA